MITDEKRNLENQYSAKVRTLKNEFTEPYERLNNGIKTRNKIIFFMVVYAVILTAILIIWR